MYILYTRVNWHFEEINKNKYLTLFPTNESKWYEEKYEELLIGSITKNSNDYDEKYMKIKFDSDDKLPLNKTIEIHSMILVVRAVFHENNKHYPQVFLDECLYKLQKLCIMIQLMFLKELILLKQVH